MIESVCQTYNSTLRSDRERYRTLLEKYKLVIHADGKMRKKLNVCFNSNLQWIILSKITEN